MIRKVQDFPNYQIDDEGKIYNKNTGRELKQCLDKGYMYVCLRRDNQNYKQRVHRLLALTFLPNPLNKEFVDHIDRNKQNNDLSNLRWATISENNINTGIRSTNTSGVKGVSYTLFDNKKPYWRASITKDKQNLSELFSYDAEGLQKAAEWRRLKELELHIIVS